jgi:hypothetical protein
MSADRRDLPMVVDVVTAVTTSTLSSSLVVPAMIAEAGDRAARRFLDFFAASIENDNTRMAYYRASARSSPGLNSTASMNWPISSRSTSPPI